MGFITIDRGPFVLCPLHNYRGSVSTRKIEACGSSVPRQHKLDSSRRLRRRGFWLIFSRGRNGEMRSKIDAQSDEAGKAVCDIRRATRRHFSAEDKIRIVIAGLRGEDNVAELCRKEGINLCVANS